MTRLLVNVDHIATLRNARREAFPDPVDAALACERAGADGIVFHLREDRRHITDRDVARMREAVRTKLDFELSMNEEIVCICLDTRPDLATLVPERREEVTTEGGLDVVAHAGRLRALVPRFHAAGIAQVAVFVDPIADHIAATADAGADAIELHTGDFANARSAADRARHLDRLAAAAEQAHGLGLTVHAGHGLDYHSIEGFLKAVPHVAEVSIGFAILARSVMVGLDTAVRDMAARVRRG